MFEKVQKPLKIDVSYYPFGLQHSGYNGVVTSNVNSTSERFNYQGQEQTTDLGLNIHEWKYRVSDPSIGRFWQVDPLGEEYEWQSVYSFASNQPIHGPELEGLENPVDLNLASRGKRGEDASRYVQENPKTAAAIGGIFALPALLLVTPEAIGSALIWWSNPTNQILTVEGTALVANSITPGGEDVFPSNGPGGEIGNAIEGIFRGFGRNIDSKSISGFADAITDINKKFSDGSQLGDGLTSVVNSASYYDDISQQGSAIFNSIVSGHVFSNGNKRTASEFITQFASDNNLNINLDSNQLQALTSEIANGTQYTIEQLSKTLFGN